MTRATSYEEFMTARGLTLSAGRVCLHRLAGKRSCGEMDDMACARLSRALDHGRLYLRDGKPALVVAEPYGLGTDALRLLLEYCAELKLVISIQAHSIWYPGETVWLEITPARVAA